MLRVLVNKKDQFSESKIHLWLKDANARCFCKIQLGSNIILAPFSANFEIIFHFKCSLRAKINQFQKMAGIQQIFLETFLLLSEPDE